MVRSIPKTQVLASMAQFTHAVYYRLYTKLGAFESNHPLYSNDRLIGCIPSKYFAPPHTMASIKLSLCRLEDLSEPDKALLFTPLSSPTPKEDSAHLSLFAPSGPGLSEQDPIALVVESEKTNEEVSQSEKLLEHSDNTHVHYNLQQVLSTLLIIVHSSALQYTITFTYQGEKEIKRQRPLSTRVIFH